MTPLRRHGSVPFVAAFVGLLLAALVAAPVAAWSHFPSRIDLPNGWAPEGLAAGRGTTLFVGSLADGAIWRGDARTGKGAQFIEPAGAPAVGLEYDRRADRLWVAGGPSGQVRVYDASTGRKLAVYTFSPAGFLNDLVVTRDAVYVTDSSNAWLDVIPLGPGGSLPAQSKTFKLHLTGDWTMGAGFNANGIEAARGFLIVVNTQAGLLFRVDPATGVARTIDTHGYSVHNGDGLLRKGSRLYVVRNLDDLVAVFHIGRHLRSARLLGELKAPGLLDVPTTAAIAAGRLYVVNARFNTPVTPTTEYWITHLPRRL